MKPKILTGIQLACIGIILITGPLLADSFLLVLLEMSGIILGLWSIQVMGIGNFHVTPTNVKGGHLVEKGPYRIIRHPMYFATWVALLPLLISHFTLFRVLVFGVLVFTHIRKLRYEESQLINHYNGYADYMKRTYHIIPFIW